VLLSKTREAEMQHGRDTVLNDAHGSYSPRQQTAASPDSEGPHGLRAPRATGQPHPQSKIREWRRGPPAPALRSLRFSFDTMRITVSGRQIWLHRGIPERLDRRAARRRLSGVHRP
jgi:hypothetical protein